MVATYLIFIKIVSFFSFRLYIKVLFHWSKIRLPFQYFLRQVPETESTSYVAKQQNGIRHDYTRNG